LRAFDATGANSNDRLCSCEALVFLAHCNLGQQESTVLCSYEAFVIYTFLSLCLGYVGGPGEVEVKMNGFMLQPSLWHCTCCLPAQRVDGLFVRRCKQGALQFVLLMPILGILSVVLYATHHYSPGYWGPGDGWVSAEACRCGRHRMCCHTAHFKIWRVWRVVAAFDISSCKIYFGGLLAVQLKHDFVSLVQISVSHAPGARLSRNASGPQPCSSN